jgi:hypothetical protein
MFTGYLRNVCKLGRASEPGCLTDATYSIDEFEVSERIIKLNVTFYSIKWETVSPNVCKLAGRSVSPMAANSPNEPTTPEAWKAACHFDDVLKNQTACPKADHQRPHNTMQLII